MKVMDFLPLEVASLWDQAQIPDALPDIIAQIFEDRMRSYLNNLTPDSDPRQEPYKSQLLDIFSAYGWLLRFRKDISAIELIQIIATPFTIQSISNSLEEKILTLSRPLSAQDAIEGWNYVEDRFFLGTALESLYILQDFSHKPDSCLKLPSHFSQTLDNLSAQISQADLQIRRLSQTKKFPDWNQWLFSLQKMAGKSLLAGNDRWLLSLAQTLTPEEETRVTAKDLTFLANNVLSDCIGDHEQRQYFANAVAEIAEYEMPVYEPEMQEMSTLNMKTQEEDAPLLFKSNLWNQLIGTCILLAHCNFQKIKEKIGFEILWQLFASLLDLRWQEGPEQGFILQSRIIWPASASQIYGKMKESYPDFMMDQGEFEKEVVLPLCEMEVFSIADSVMILYCLNIGSLLVTFRNDELKF